MSRFWRSPTKEFLNELVRRFPERPPIRTTRVQNKILEAIEEWQQTICQTSKYREDLGFIRDMHRLLSIKGYVFPTVKREDAAVLNPSDNLKSAEEMEEEERAAQSAKLQELIRRGTPHDLQEANKLMKVMAGYDTRHKPDYRAKAAEEVGRIQQKARLLEEMLQGYKPGDEVKEGDVFEELANALASAHPKIQKMCEEESDDTEAVAKLFEINDSIHRTIERYKLIKKGDLEGANKIPRGTLGTSGAGVTKGPDNELSLIDFGDSGEPAMTPTVTDSKLSTLASSAPARKGNALEDDLLGLSMSEGSFGSSGAISLGTSNGLSAMAASASALKQSAPAPLTSKFASSAPRQEQQTPALNPNYDPFASLGSSRAQSKPVTPVPSTLGQPSQQPFQTRADPFASLNTPPRQASPFQFQQSVNLSSSPVPAARNNAPAAPHQSTLLSNSVIDSSAEDEWTFSSALPDQAHDLTVTNSSIRTVFHVTRLPGAENVIAIDSRISNNTSQPVSDLTFQLAVTKGYSLKLQPQSGRALAPQQANGITQTIRLQGVEPGKGTSIKMRWKASYRVGAEQKEETGEITTLGVA
ncbi:ARF-binding protein [Elasticomyces elasticus]|nr:ARF-binding protein [Elasticomyces elasticus]